VALEHIQTLMPSTQWICDIYSPLVFMLNIQLTLYSECSINNQHYALNYTTSLFNKQVPTCFDNSLPSSGSFLDSSELPEMQIERVVFHIMYVYVCSCSALYKRLDVIVFVVVVILTQTE
jgi:hypothetical protein